MNTPEKESIHIRDLKPENVLYFVKTPELDKIICARRRIPYNQELADKFNAGASFYFVIRKDLKFSIISSVLFDPWVKENEFICPEESDQAKEVIEFYIQSLT